MLPEKWFVLRNKQNAKVLNDWNNRTYPNSGVATANDLGIFYSNKSYNSNGVKGHIKNHLEKGYVEISFEKFQEEVLKIIFKPKYIVYGIP